MPTRKRSEKGADTDQTQPVYIGEVPQVVRDAQTTLMQKPVAGIFCFLELHCSTL